MWSVSKKIAFCAGHRLLEYKGDCRFLHGHNFCVEVTVKKPVLNHVGMVMDFKEIHDHFKRWIDAHWDHGFIVSEFDSLIIPFLQDNGQKHYVLTYEQMEISYEILELSLGAGKISATNPTMENLAVVLLCQGARQLNVSPKFLSIRLWESDTSYAQVE